MIEGGIYLHLLILQVLSSAIWYSYLIYLSAPVID